MAAPVADSYNVGSGTIYGGMSAPADINDLLNTVLALSENKWLKLNTNLFSDVWPAAAYRSPYGVGTGSPDAVIEAWSSFAWDSKNHRLILWGGGHANTSDNSVYMWDATTQLWSLAFYPSDYYTIGAGEHTPICGGARQPCSSHTYDNQLYLPIIDRFVTFGGAQHGNGGAFRLYDGSYNYLRIVPAYTLDLSQAGMGYVAGGTGDDAHSTETLTGVNAWVARDWLADTTGDAFGTKTAATDCATAYREENGKDVVYVTKHSSGAKDLFRVEFTDDTPSNDVITKVGRYFNGSSGEFTAAIDTANNLFVSINRAGGTTYPFMYWDLAAAGPTNNDVRIHADSIVGSGKAAFLADSDFSDLGMDYHAGQNKFFLWGRSGHLYTLQATGNPDPKTEWTIEQITTTGDRPATAVELGSAVDTGVLGKFKYASDLNCFIALQHNTEGNVWLYKPAGWIDPRT